jgi:hypothetical protein
MGVYRMENFEVPDIASLNVRGFTIPANNSNFTTAIQSFTDQGVTRKRLQINHLIDANQGRYMIGLPFPTSGAGYLSFKMRTVNNGNSRQLIQRVSLNMGTGAANVSNNVLWEMTNNKIGTTASGQEVGAQVNTLPYNFDTDYKVEAYRSATGDYRIWIDDFLILPTSGVSLIAPGVQGSLQLVFGTQNGVSPPPTITTYIWDLVAVDPATAGLQYRPGRTARVLPVTATADVITEWTGGDGTAHYSQLADFVAAPGATGYITANVVGKREQYQQGNILAGFGQQVLSVGFEHYVANAGAAAHTLTAELDTGSGIVSVADLLLPSGGAYQFAPVYQGKKPDNTNWTYADVAALKSGFSIKS